MPKCDFNKDAKQFYWNHTSAWVFSCNFARIFRALFPRNTSGWLPLSIISLEDTWGLICFRERIFMCSNLRNVFYKYKFLKIVKLVIFCGYNFLQRQNFHNNKNKTPFNQEVANQSLIKRSFQSFRRH